MKKWDGPIVLIVLLSHLYWSIGLAFSAEPMNTSPVFALRIITSNQHALSAILFLSCFAAACSMTGSLSKSKQFLALIPQASLMLIGGYGAVVCIVNQSYADHTIRPFWFISSDQIRTVLLAVFHTAIWIIRYA